MIDSFLFLLVSVSTWGLTGVLCRYALARNLIDIPNDRSSHAIPTPRGGGVAVVLVFLSSLWLVTWLKLFPLYACIALSGAGAIVALVGFLDDHQHIAARWRLLIHFAAAVWGLYWLGGFPTITLLGLSIETNWLGFIAAAVYTVWSVNLYNFMDGIDGLASIEAITVCVGAALMAWLVLPEVNLWLVPILLALAVLGFLVWNFPPARIFMGDAGSGFLGIMLALLSIHSTWFDARLFWIWLILLGVFIVDATMTLCRRIFRGEKFYEAHRSHAYQFASRIAGGHRPVTLIIAVINLIWLTPIAAMVAYDLLDGGLALIVAYIPLIGLAYRFKAGDHSAQSELCT